MTADQGVTITWLGHATTRVDTPSGKTVLIDPWLEHNPATPDNLARLHKLDLMLITHGHFDHMGDAVDVARGTQPDVICNAEIAHYLGSKGVENLHGMNKGGTITWSGIAITMVDAVHSSGITEGDHIVDGGSAAGFIIRFENGFTLYHAGDTDLFEGFRIIGRMYEPDAVMLPIGDHFTMGPRQAAEALRMLGATVVIPIHYGTFPLLTGTPEALKHEARDIRDLRVITLNPGESASQNQLV